MQDIVIVEACRTAVGDFGGGLKDTAPCELGALVVRSVLERAGVAAAEVGHVVFGHVINTEPRDMYLSRVAALNAGIPEAVPAFNVNRLCGSGLQAIVSAAQVLMLGDAEIAIGAGAESMSRAPYLAIGQRWGSCCRWSSSEWRSARSCWAELPIESDVVPRSSCVSAS